MKAPKLPSLRLGSGRWPAPLRWGVLGVAFLGLIAFTGKRRHARTIPEIKVEVVEKEGLHFVDEEETFALVQGQILQDIKEQGSGQSLRLGRLERLLEKNPFIHTANISQDLNGRITVEIHQSRPIARILGVAEGDYYVTDEARVIPVSPLYTSRVLLLEGPGARRMVRGLPAGDTLSTELFQLVKHIQADKFWNAQATQLSVSAQGDVRLFPQVGQQVFDLGPPVDLDSKFRRLQAFYSDILPHKGWARYHTVSVKYQHQIVCE